MQQRSQKSIPALLVPAFAAAVTCFFVALGTADVDAGLQDDGSDFAESTGADLEASRGAGEREFSTPIQDEPAREVATRADDSGPRVRVVLGQKPVANARVASLSYRDFQNFRWKAAKHDSVGRIVEKHGLSTRADASGVAPVIDPPLSSWSNENYAIVAAWNETHFGYAWFPIHELKQKSIADLSIEVDKTLVIRVVDTNGKPQAKFPLSFYQVRPNKPADFVQSCTTRNDGRLVIAHWKNSVWSVKDRFVVLPTIPYREPYFVAFTTESLEKEYTLRVGATGAMSFIVKARDGGIVRASASVELRPSHEWPKIETCSFKVPTIKRRSVGGKLAIARIGLGMSFKASVDIGNSYSPGNKVEYAGPTRAGETTCQYLALGTRGIRLEGAITLAEKRPLATAAQLSVSFQSPGSSPSLQSVDCAADGSFSLYLPYSGAGDYGFALSSVVDNVKFEARRTATIDGWTGRVDLGMVTLAVP